MIVRILSDVARFVVNMAMMIVIVGVLVAGGVVIKLWRMRP